MFTTLIPPSGYAGRRDRLRLAFDTLALRFEAHVDASRLLALVVILLTMFVSGCATVQRPDPLEPMNRKVFAFNEGVDKVILKPVAIAYKAVVPSPVRTGVTNFFSNVKDPWSAVNLMLQGRVKEGFSDVARFATNTVVGGLGFVDLATGWGMPRHGEDFGQTLGVWGVDTGAYLVLPLLGPSDLRDTAALPVDSLAQAQTFIHNVPVRNSLTALQTVNKRANLLQAGALLDDIALDKYTFIRDAFLQRRRNLVHGADHAADNVADGPDGVDSENIERSGGVPNSMAKQAENPVGPRACMNSSALLNTLACIRSDGNSLGALVLHERSVHTQALPLASSR